MRALLSAQLGGRTHGIFQSRDPDKAAAVSIVASGLAAVVSSLGGRHYALYLNAHRQDLGVE